MIYPQFRGCARGFSESSLKAHTVPVVDIAVSRSRALLASGDVHGRVVLPGPRAGRGGIEAEGDGGGRGLEVLREGSWFC